MEIVGKTLPQYKQKPLQTLVACCGFAYGTMPAYFFALYGRKGIGLPRRWLWCALVTSALFCLHNSNKIITFA